MKPPPAPPRGRDACMRRWMREERRVMREERCGLTKWQTRVEKSIGFSLHSRIIKSKNM